MHFNTLQHTLRSGVRQGGGRTVIRQIHVRPQVYADGSPVWKTVGCPDQQQSTTTADVQDVPVAGQLEAVKQAVTSSQFAIAAAPNHEQGFDNEDDSKREGNTTDGGQPTCREDD